MGLRDAYLNQACPFIKTERDCLRIHQLGMLKRLSDCSRAKKKKKTTQILNLLGIKNQN